MGLPPCSISEGRGYTAIIFTFGPRPADLTREQVQDVFKSYYRGWLREMIVAFETSKKGYEHCHVGVRLRAQKKLTMPIFNKVKKTLCDPNHPTKKPNCDSHYVPCAEGRGYEVIKNYLVDPKKIKETDDGYLELLPEKDWIAELARVGAITQALLAAKKHFRKTGQVLPGFIKAQGKNGTPFVKMDPKRNWSEWARKNSLFGKGA